MGAEPVAVLYASISLKLDASCNREPVQGDKERCDMGPFGFAEDQSCLGMGIIYILSIPIPVLIDTVIDSIWCKKI